MPKVYKITQEEPKIEVQPQQTNYYMHEELAIFPAFATLKIFNTHEKYI